MEVPNQDQEQEEQAGGVNQAELALPTKDRLLYTELKWFAGIILNANPDPSIIEVCCEKI
jgi:hypothetical protein